MKIQGRILLPNVDTKPYNNYDIILLHMKIQGGIVLSNVDTKPDDYILLHMKIQGRILLSNVNTKPDNYINDDKKTVQNESGRYSHHY